MTKKTSWQQQSQTTWRVGYQRSAVALKAMNVLGEERQLITALTIIFDIL
jgi:hypothetical protein